MAKTEQAPQCVNEPALPDDIVHNICELVCLEDAVNFQTKSIERFQLACRQFRSIALASPYLWSCVDDRMTTERIGLQLSRSGDLGMSVRMEYIFDQMDDANTTHPPCKCAQWGIIHSNQRRWTNAQITIVYFLRDDTPIESEHRCILTFPLKNLTFPSALTLTPVIALDSRVKYIHPIFERAFSNLEEVILIGNWELGNMGILRNDVHSLRRVTAAVEPGGYQWTSSLLRLLSMPSISSIRMLTIDFSRSFKVWEFDLTDYEDVTLVNLETLVALLTGDAVSMGSSPPYSVLAKIKMPNIKNISLKLGRSTCLVDNDTTYADWLKQLVHPSIEKVEVVFTGTYTEDQMDDKHSEVLGSLPGNFVLNPEEAAECNLPLAVISFEDD